MPQEPMSLTLEFLSDLLTLYLREKSKFKTFNVISSISQSVYSRLLQCKSAILLIFTISHQFYFVPTST